ncbi:MAG TPA: sugar transferase [Acidimicrobiales bacterium]|nr:sugar transferase [Acidimicrobiales bacterium]
MVAEGQRSPVRTEGGRRGRPGRRAAEAVHGAVDTAAEPVHRAVDTAAEPVHRAVDTAAEAVHRAVDIVVAGGLLLLTAPLTLAGAAAVRLTLGRPVLFRQERIGRGGAPFELVKLRTMRAAPAGQGGPESDRRRLTPLGRLLRASSVDELPSLVAVLRGDMSVVGPRPLPVRYLSRYSPRQARRHEVRPGLTGWAQVNGRNRVGWDERLELDVWYVEHRSLRLDLRIIARTVPVVLGRTGVSADGHATMPELAERTSGR